MSSSVDMFYTLQSSSTSVTYTITVPSTSFGILSITDIKAALSSGYRAILVTSSSVSYGSNAAKTHRMKY